MAFELFIFIVPLILILLTYTIHHCVFSLCTSVYYTWFLGIVYMLRLDVEDESIA